MLVAKGVVSMRRIIKILKSPKIRPANLLRALRATFDDKVILAWWEESTETRRNFGDALNPVLIRLLSGKIPINTRRVLRLTNKEVYSIIGSILDYANDSNLVIWGTGFQHESSRMKVKPKRVCAVRGPLTRTKLIEQGVDCPAVFGDPALLLPLFYKPKGNVERAELGIVPHYIDKGNPVLRSFAKAEEVKIIDIESGITNVIDEICSCDFIASSSLHGLIVADAYGIPSVWIKLSDRVLGRGFKFRDYFLSIGKPQREPVVANKHTSANELIEKCTQAKVDRELLQCLLDACPFKKPDIGMENLPELDKVEKQWQEERSIVYTLIRLMAAQK